ncbi:methionine adenosyltransferase [Halapricum hydrolyticum]|uniref:S-adenosylmethionine synthase n=1 Tax=Halapricum hydrolyticum TaxID=2979991 RepID=A0AAE3LIS8_9EURY|nr:methionine adenosyltransferase [Halapricum hydrolyticum]MCU4719173.1 methionine adenosyltransferase [Halapricum hydrolyticum]MCU4728264.1 methionine adenosyltransferase [Halapricum hydrolyticum]
MSQRNIRVQPTEDRAVEDQDVEIVERKGIGHPDSICDGVAESVSRALAQEYLDRYGTVLHYNTDETQLVAGTAAPAFGGGEVLDPIYLLVVGRATKTYDGRRFPAESIALEAARNYLDETFPSLDVGTDVIVDVKLGEGSGDLQEVFGEDGAVPMANDTSYGVGHAPLTETEQIVLNTERKLNGPYSDDNPAVGQDIKVMGKREGDHIDVTVAVAVIDDYVENMSEYRETIEGVREYVRDLASEYTDRSVDVHVNTADNYDEGAIYLTTTGTSAEQGDDGSVGRGNRANGLITPNRPMSMEATSGKNPVNHIGKIYNLLSTKIAQSVADRVEGIQEVQIRLLSQIGQPIDKPHVADAQLVTDDGVSVADVESAVEATIDEELANITDVTEAVIEGDISTF